MAPPRARRSGSGADGAEAGTSGHDAGTAGTGGTLARAVGPFVPAPRAFVREAWPPSAHRATVRQAADAMPPRRPPMRLVTLAALAALGLVPSHAARRPRPPRAPAPKLHIELVGADSTAFDVVSALVVGPTEVLAWDAQYHVADARRLADRIAATGKRLTAIVISHPDHDHFSGAAVLVERFPGTPVYMTRRAIAWYDTTAARAFQGEKARRPAALPDSLVTPRELPSTRLTVDGEAVEVIPDLTGDVIAPTNSVLWIPSLRAALVGDVAFDGVHPWLGSSDEASRAAWRAAVRRVADLHPAVVVAGHKRDVASPDAPAVLAFMDRYLRDFDALRKTAAGPEALRDAMLARYPDLAVRGLLAYGARVAFQPPPRTGTH
jgi:glyoxylase-like metal-dependent hydrolase (beta-lactamase superfamily II)